MLTVESVHIWYGSICALRGVSLDVADGGLVGLVGPNGAGKSTLLHAIMGLVRIDSGAIALQGRSLIGERTEKIVSRGVALVPEGRHIFGTLTVEENLRMGVGKSTDRTTYAQRLDRVCTYFPLLRSCLRTSAVKLSGGEQQQLAIGRALLGNPKLLLLDEPSLGLAPKVVDTVFEVITALRAEGVTVLLVEQNAARTVATADRTYILRGGEVAGVGHRGAFGEATLAAAYLGGGAA